MKIVITLLLLIACQSFNFSLHKKASSFIENKIALKFSSYNSGGKKEKRDKNPIFKTVKCSMISEDDISEGDNNLRLDEDAISIIKDDSVAVKINYSE
jgi:hypothetical protein